MRLSLSRLRKQTRICMLFREVYPRLTISRTPSKAKFKASLWAPKKTLRWEGRNPTERKSSALNHLKAQLLTFRAGWWALRSAKGVSLLPLKPPSPQSKLLSSNLRLILKTTAQLFIPGLVLALLEIQSRMIVDSLKNRRMDRHLIQLMVFLFLSSIREQEAS